MKKTNSEKRCYIVFNKIGKATTFCEFPSAKILAKSNYLGVFNPDRIKRPKYLSKTSPYPWPRPSFTWDSHNGAQWRIYANKFPIIPNCLHSVIIRDDKFVHQREMKKYKNIFDMLFFLYEINDTKKDLEFCLGINGWYYSNKNKKSRTATFERGHAQFIRFNFPIERVKTDPIKTSGGVNISLIKDLEKWGAGIFLEASRKNLKHLAKLASFLLDEITKTGNSFSFFAFQPRHLSMKIFICGRTKCKPSAFKSGWSFSEIAGVPIFSYKEDLWKNNMIRPDLIKRLQKSLKEVTVQENQLRIILKKALVNYSFELIPF